MGEKKDYNIYYVPYCLNRNVNYAFLLCLYGIAKREDKEGKGIKSIITYKTFADLQGQIFDKCEYKISVSTISRIFKNDIEEYKNFFSFVASPKEKRIILNNDFSHSKGNGKSFVRLYPNIYKYLIKENNNFLSMYVLYLIYQCGLGKGSTDSTAEQFLISCGYCINSNSQKEKLCVFNKGLAEKGIFKIEQNIINGRKRNTYFLLLGQ